MLGYYIAILWGVILFIIFPCYPLNKWVLHNKWNHSDWATFLSGFLGATITLIGIRMQIKKNEELEFKERTEGIVHLVFYTLKQNLISSEKLDLYDIYFSKSYLILLEIFKKNKEILERFGYFNFKLDIEFYVLFSLGIFEISSKIVDLQNKVKINNKNFDNNFERISLINFKNFEHEKKILTDLFLLMQDYEIIDDKERRKKYINDILKNINKMISSSELNKNDYKYKQYYSEISELIDFEINNKEIDWKKIYKIIEIIFNFMHEEREFNIFLFYENEKILNETMNIRKEMKNLIEDLREYM